MAQLSRKLRSVQGPALSFWCPGCDQAHTVGVGTNGWHWNGDAERPVFNPSVAVSGYRITRDAAGKWDGGWELDASGNPVPMKCHSFVGCNGAQPGQIVFLGDSTHLLAGRVVDLPDWPSASQED